MNRFATRLGAALGLGLSIVAGAKAQEFCADPTASCGRLIQPRCLQSMGAGVLRVDGVGAEASGGCDAQLSAYQQCLSRVAGECDGGGAGGALDLSRLPSIQPFQATSCYSEISRQMMCQGAGHVLSVMVTSGDETDMKVFGTMKGGVYALDGGAPRRLVDLEGKVNAFANFAQSVAMTLPEAPATLGFCLTFRPGGVGAEWGVAQASRFTPQLPPETAKVAGQQLYMAAPASHQTVFAAAESDCAAELAAIAARQGF